MMTADERLVQMANQIARNLAAQGEEHAVLATADHIAAFWDPRMRARLLAMNRPPLDSIAARALALLRDRGAPPHQSLVTSAQGGSDAG